MNEAVRKIINMEKREFCLQHDLFTSEYMPYLLKGEGTVSDGRRIKFQRVTTNRYNIGDTINVKFEGETVAVKISTFEYEYAPDTIYADCEPIRDVRFPNQVRYCKKTITDITDEEFQLLRQLYPPKPQSKQNKAPIETNVDTVLCIIGVMLCIAGAISGLAIGSGYRGNPAMGWTLFIVGFIQMCLFIGFGKVIELLCMIANRQ